MRQFNFGSDAPTGLARLSCGTYSGATCGPRVTSWMDRQSHHSSRCDSVTPDPLARLRPTWRHVGNPTRTGPMSHANQTNATGKYQNLKISFGQVHLLIFLKKTKYIKKSSSLSRFLSGHAGRVTDPPVDALFCARWWS
jgi:hypothetical protein